MKKRIVILIGSIVVLIALGSGGWIWFQKNRGNKSSPVSQVPVPTPFQEEMAVWNDPAGFTFEYPKSVIVDTHKEDTQNYAHIEIKKNGQTGTVFVWAKDTDADTVDQWVQANSEASEAAIVDTTLGGLAGKKLQLKEPKKKIAATVSDSIVFSIELVGEGDAYMQYVYDSVVKNFTLTNQEGESIAPQAGESDGSGEAYVDEEETIE